MEPYGYSPFNDFNRFQNLDGIEAKIVEHLINSQSKHADIFWKLLKYNDLYALSQPSVSIAERKELVNYDNGYGNTKRVFFQPFVDDAWQEQCSSIYIYVDSLYPINHLTSFVGIKVETVTHSKIAAVSGDGDRELNPDANPNDSDSEGNIVVAFKNRATVLLKCILAELNGIYIDGVGYVSFDTKSDIKGKVEKSLFNGRNFYGHVTTFVMEISGVSGSSSVGY